MKSCKSHKWIRVGLLWGLFMYLFNVLLFPLLRGEKITLAGIVIGIPLWIIGGLFFGSCTQNK
jgi:hypothetical protein